MKLEKGHQIKVLDHGYVRLIDFMGSDQRIIEAARISYHGASKGEEADKKLLQYLWKNRHTSPFEMCKVTFNVKLPIFVMRQWVRHRMQNLNEVSARYTELPGEFYIPEVWRKNLGAGQNKQQSVELEKEPLIALQDDCGEWTSFRATEATRIICERAYKDYKQFLEAGIARELARMVLPINIYTEIYSTWDLKNLLHFITLREDAHAQLEIQAYSNAMKDILIKLFPWTMEAFDKFKFELKEI